MAKKKFRRSKRKHVQEQLRQELEMLQGRSATLNPRKVVDWAEKNPESALYHEFEWDDSKAAREYRLIQARELIKTIVVYPSEMKPRWVSLTIDRVKGGGYRRTEAVQGTPNLRRILVQDVLDELIRMRDRYFDLTELDRAWHAIDYLEVRFGNKAARRAVAAARPRPARRTVAAAA